MGRTLDRGWIAALCLLCPAAGWGAGEETKPASAWTYDLSGEVRLRGEWRDDNDLDRNLDDDRREGFMRVRLGVAFEKKDEVRVFIQAQDSRVSGEEANVGSATDPTLSDEENLDLHQGYVEVRAFARSGLILYAGRREWTYGDHRVIGNFAWNNFGRAFDGVTLRWKSPKIFWIDGFYAQLDQDATPDGGTRGDGLYGTYAQWAPRPGDEVEGYAMAFHDSTRLAGEAGSGASQVKMVGGRVRSKIQRFEYRAEAAVQRGEFAGDDHRAWAAAAILGLDLGSAKRWRAIGGYDYATGDRDSTDGVDQEFFNFFPTNHPLYGYMDLFGWRNITSPWAGVAFSEGRHWAQAKVHKFDLQDEHGRWKNAGGASLGFDATGGSGRCVGREIDLIYRFKWGEKVALEADLSRFDPDDFAEATRGSDPSHFGYLMLTVGF